MPGFSATPISNVIEAIRFPSFRQLYTLPWTVGAQLGIWYSTNIRFFTEANYYCAYPLKSKGSGFLLPGLLPVLLMELY